MNYTTWFHPDVTIIDEHAWNISSSVPSSPSGEVYLDSSSPSSEEANSNSVIRPGDLLHVDFGVTALGLNTDTQHLAYVLPHSQCTIPDSYLAGLKKANRAQDIVLSHLKVGNTGNEILLAVLSQLKKENITGKIYCHPIGDWGHSAGPVIGMTNLQEGVPVLGDLPVLKGMYYSIELLVEHFIEEQATVFRFPVEEDVRRVPTPGKEWDDKNDKGRWVWAYGQRQEKFHVVKTRSGEATGTETDIFDSGDL